LEELVSGCFVGLEFESSLEAVGIAGLGRSQDSPSNIVGTVLQVVASQLSRLKLEKHAKLIYVTALLLQTKVYLFWEKSSLQV